MSVESEILRIQHNIANTYAAVAEKGGEVPLQPTSANLAAAVNTIPNGTSFAMPKGTIVIWSGAADAIPTGWHICDGEDGTPDLRGKFVLGATTELDEAGNTAHPVGSSGGEEEVTLTVEQMPEHRHFYERWSTSNAAKGTGTLNISGSYAGQTDPMGSSQPHNNMPPYYTLCYIMKMVDGATSGGSNSSSSNDVYSEEETRIGTWIDGKPLYRKAETGLLRNESKNLNRFFIDQTFRESVDTIIKLYGCIKGYNNDNQTKAVMSFFPHSEVQWMLSATYTQYSARWRQDSGIIIRALGNPSENDPFYARDAIVNIILEYTKTTDTPEVS